MEKNELIMRAKMSGSKAPVDAAPDMMFEGFQLWKENVANYFRGHLDRFISENHPNPNDELHDEIVEAMKDGFKTLVQSQPYIENPFHPKEAPPRPMTIRLINEAMEELKIDVLRRNELVLEARASGSKAPLVIATVLSVEGFQSWKEDVVNHFRRSLDRFFDKYHPNPSAELHDKIVEAMKDGFKTRVHGQTFFENPFHPEELPLRRKTIGLIEEAFAELKRESRSRRFRYS